MSEVKGNLTSANSSGNISTTRHTVPNTNTTKPLESSTPALHPLPRNQPATVQTHAAQHSTAAKVTTPEQNKIQFNSANGSKNAIKANPFAEQNAKRAEKKKQQKQKQKKIITVSSIIGSLIIVGVITTIVFLFVNNSEPDLTSSEVNKQEAQNAYQEALNKIDYGAIVDGMPSDENVAEANETFEKYISEAVNSNNTNAADAMRVAQMLFYNSASVDYAKIIAIGESVENVSNLELKQQLQFYNLMANAYTAVENQKLADEYYDKLVEVAEKLESMEEN